jgi:hypothetical protein
MASGQILFKQTKTLLNFLHNIIFVDFSFFNKNGANYSGIVIVAEGGTEGEEDIAVIGVITGMLHEPVDLKEYSVITAIGMTKSLKPS